MHTQKRHGFTIVELLIVIVVLGILVAIAAVAYKGSQQRSNDDARNTKTTQISEALESYYQNNNEYPSEADISGKSISVLKTLLGIISDDVFVFPGNSSNVSSFDAPPSASAPSTSKLLYTCANSTGSGNYCDTYTLSYKKQIDSSTVSMKSRSR